MLFRPSPMFLAAKRGLPPAPSVASVYAASLWTGNAAARTITNSVNMSGKGALAWIKNRGTNLTHHIWMDTVRGASTALLPTAGGAEQTSSTNFLSAFTTTGYSMNPGIVTNVNSATYVGWAFAQNQRFFKMISYTGTGAPRFLTHDLAVEPGFIIIFARDGSSGPVAWFRGIGDTDYFEIASGGAISNDTDDTFASMGPTEFYTDNNTYTNGSGVDYMAYVFAHDENTDGICLAGSYTGNGTATGPTVTLGWQPRFLFIKRDGNSPAVMFDAVRGLTTSTIATEPTIQLTTAAETNTNLITVTSTGFFPKSDNTVNGNGSTYYFWAIRT